MKNERTGFVYVKPGCNNGRSKVKYNKAGWLFLDYYVKVRVLVKSVVYMAFKKKWDAKSRRVQYQKAS